MQIDSRIPFLIKNTFNEETGRDNFDKKKLFSEDQKISNASTYRDSFSYVEDESNLENISYQLQYIEFLTKLYNTHQIYLTLESLLLKDIMIHIAIVFEILLTNLVIDPEYRNVSVPFVELIDKACNINIINTSHKVMLHKLREIRNTIHLHDVTYREYNAYTVEEANDYIELLHELTNRFASKN